MQEVMEETGITATAGVGTNLYLAKIAMDIVAKHVDDHIGILDEFSYRVLFFPRLSSFYFLLLVDYLMRK